MICPSRGETDGLKSLANGPHLSLSGTEFLFLTQTDPPLLHCQMQLTRPLGRGLPGFPGRNHTAAAPGYKPGQESSTDDTDHQGTADDDPDRHFGRVSPARLKLRLIRQNLVDPSANSRGRCRPHRRRRGYRRLDPEDQGAQALDLIDTRGGIEYRQLDRFEDQLARCSRQQGRTPAPRAANTRPVDRNRTFLFRRVDLAVRTRGPQSRRLDQGKIALTLKGNCQYC